MTLLRTSSSMENEREKKNRKKNEKKKNIKNIYVYANNVLPGPNIDDV